MSSGTNLPKRATRDNPTRHLKRKSAVSMAFRAVKKKKKTYVRSTRKPAKRCRSFAPKALQTFEDYHDSIGVFGEDVIAQEWFYDEYLGTGVKKSRLDPYVIPVIPAIARQRSTAVKSYGNAYNPKKSTCGVKVHPQNQKNRPSGLVVVKRSNPTTNARPRKGGNVDRDDESDGDYIPDFIEDMFDNSNRHALGMNLMGRLTGLCGGGGDGSSANAKIDRSRRPFFTYWVTVIQIVIFIVSVSTYGFAPVGLDTNTVTSQVLMVNLAKEKVALTEKSNMWIGPSQVSLIYLGAKYSPCMREDKNIDDMLAIDRNLENQTACCVYNDGSGCVQTLEKDCSAILSTWFKWTPDNPGFESRISGTVCGQDPRYCSDPASSGAFVWKDDITTWPICKDTLSTAVSDTNHHMSCSVVGRPCCVGIQGKCVIATREYCDFLGGFFNENATLCSQVYCMEQTCGMFTFLQAHKPDQFYRLFTSLFLHAGLIGLFITVVFQFVFMRDMEKLIGWWRMTLIYVVCGVAGSLGSAIFLPYLVEAGPAGAQFGVLGIMLTEVMRWNKDTNPWKGLLSIGVVLLLLFFLGAVLSQVDNYAHLFGLCFGCLLCAGLRPYQSACGMKLSMAAKVISSVVCFVMAAILFSLLVYLFYVMPVYDCNACMYFNCIPFTSTYCVDQMVTISSDSAST